MKSLIIAKKEILDLTRDRRTLMFMFGFPLLFMPLFFIGGMSYVKQAQEKAVEKNLKIVMYGGEYAPEINKAFTEISDITILNDINKDSIENYIQEELIDAAIYIDKNYQIAISNNKQAQIQLQFKGTDSFGVTQERISRIIKNVEKEIIKNRAKDLELDLNILTAFNLKILNVASEKEIIGKSAGGYLPYFLILLGFMGALYPALDLGAGEKERGTLETLLSSPASRLDIVIGKVIVVTLSALASSLSAIIGIFLSFKANPQIPNQMISLFDDIINVTTILTVFSLIVPICVFFASILLAISIYAKSFKEAQTISAPFQFLIIIPVLLTLLPGTELNAFTALVPILNVSLATKEVIAGSITTFYMIEVFLSLFAYAGLSIMWCVYSFNQEGTIFRN